jgi:DNA-directed RNA polymerase III subunit RPC8
MFILQTLVDTVRIPPHMLAQPTLVSVHSEMDTKYPNRVLMDVGLVVCRFGDALQLGDGVCVAGDGGAHHEVISKWLVFRPFVEEVCLGYIAKSTRDGILVSMDFFEDIFIPAYWMLRPSQFEEETGLWVWTPNYGDDEEKAEPERFDMDLGAEIRFKVKSINFTRVTNTAKGVQATTTTTSHSVATPTDQGPVRKRSTSIDISDSATEAPASMHIVATICEDGLGLTSWWSAAVDDEDDVVGE